MMAAAVVAALALAAGCGGAAPPAAGWTEVSVRDVSVPGVRRVNAVILVPPGLSRERVSALLESAAREIGEREKARAVLLDAFRWEDEVREGTYSVGRLYYAPNGRWEDAATGAPMAARVELGTLYFLEDRRYYAAGDTALLAGAPGAGVPLYRTPDTSRSDQVAASFPDGTPAVVVGRSIKVFGGRTEHIRYRVAAGAGEGRAEGWVPPEALRPPGGK